jgi:hypothetical protein
MTRLIGISLPVAAPAGAREALTGRRSRNEKTAPQGRRRLARHPQAGRRCAVPQARRRRTAAPTRPSPASIMASEPASGTAVTLNWVTSALVSTDRLSPLP